MALVRRSERSVRRVVLSGVAAVLVSLSCGPDLTGPRAGRLSNGIAFLTEFPSQVAGGTNLVPFNRVHIVLSRFDETTALDTIVNYPATGELSLSLRVRLSPDAPSEGETLSMFLEYLNAAGDVVFTGGPTTVLAVPAGNVATEPVSIPVVYVGPGSNATQVLILGSPASVLNGDPFTFGAVAMDGQGQPIAGTPIGWRSLDPTIATITAVSAGVGVAQNVRGTARIVAQLLTGPADTITVNVSLRASLLTVVSGNAQSGGSGLALTNPLVVRVTASDGVPVPGVNVTFAVASGGGSLGTPSVPTDANGFAQTTWQLGALVGAQTVTATAAGIAGSVTFNATGTSVGPTQLAFVQQPSNVTAGIPIGPAITVVARDAQGANVPSFVGNVTISIGANPGLSGISGTLTAAAVGGVATFNDVRLNRAASGYTLVASSGALTNATSTPFNVVAAPAILAIADSGDAQVGSTGNALSRQIVVKVIDSLANGVAGVPIFWNSPSAGGGITGSTTPTDANGRARATWTLGGVIGTQTVDVLAIPLDQTVTFTATAAPPGVTKVWTGATNTSWTTASNWSPAGVPIPTDGVLIPVTGADPVMAGNVTIASLTVESSALMDLSTTTLTVNGSVTAFGSIFGSGTVILNGTGTFQGFVVGANQMLVQGNYTLNGPSSTGRLEVKGSLNFGGQALAVAGTFLTADNGTITMNNVSDALAVSGDAFFSGGSEAGLLNFGSIQVHGNFSQTAGTSSTSYVASQNHMTMLVGAGTQTVSFATPDTVTLAAVCAGSCFGELVILKTTGNTTFNTAASIRGALSVLTNNGTVAAIGAVGSPKVITVGGETNISIGGQVHFTRFRTTGDVSLQASTVIDTIGFSGNAGQTVPSTTFGTVQFLGSPTLGGPLTVTGNLTVANGAASAAVLTLGGDRVDVGGNLIVTNGGTILMNGVADSLVVAGNVAIGGGVTSTFDAGVIVVGGDFTQTNGATFAAGGSHKVVLNGAGLQTISFANPGVSFFRRLFAEKSSGSVNLASNVQVNGVFRAATSITGPSPVRLLADTVWGAIGSNMTPFVVEIRRSLVDSGTFSPDTTVFIDGANTSIVTTAGFGLYTYKSIRSHKLINTTSIGVSALTLQNDFVVSSGTLLINGSKVTVNGNLRTEGGGAIQMTGAGDSVGVAGNASFLGGSTSTIMTNGVLTIGGNFTQGGINSSFAGTANHRVKFIGSAPGVHTIQFASPTTSFFRDLILDKPLGTGQVITLLSNVLVTDSMTVRNGTTLNSAANQRLTVQGRFHFQYIGGVNIPTVSPFVLELTTLAPALDSIIPGPPAPKFLPDTLVFTGAVNSFMPFSNYTALRSVRVSVGPTNIVDMFLSGANDTLGGDLHITSGRARMQFGSTIMRKLRTTNTGALEMSVSQPTILVRDSAIFAGGSVNPLLTSGTLRVMGHFVQSGANSPSSFNAHPPHTTEFAGTTLQNITMGTPGFTAALAHFANFRVTNPVGVNLQTDVAIHVLLDQTPGTQEKVFGNGFKLTAEGTDVRNMLFDNTLVGIVDGIDPFPVTRFDTVAFQNYPGTPTILTVTRAAIFPKFNGLVFPTTGFNGRYVFLTAPVNTNLTLDLVVPAQPPTNLALFGCTGGGLIIWNTTRLSGSGC